MAIINYVSIFIDRYTQAQTSGSCFQRKILDNELPGEEKTVRGRTNDSRSVIGENMTFQDIGDQHKSLHGHPR